MNTLFLKAHKVSFVLLVVILSTFFVSSSFGANSILALFDPASIEIVSGDNQFGNIGTLLPDSLIVKVLNDNGDTLPIVEVTFTIISGGGTLSKGTTKSTNKISTFTDSQGRANVKLTLGNTKTVNQVRASVSGVTPVVFTETVLNSKPILAAIGSKEVNEGATLRFTVSASDINPDDVLTLTANPLPTNATFDTSNGVFTFTPDFSQAGTHIVIFTVNDGTDTDSENVTITVRNVNRPPVLSPIADYTIDEGSELTIVVLATDPDSETLTYSISGMPTGATFNAAQRTFKWTPGYNTAPSGGKQDFQVTFIVKDPSGISDSEKITITVNDVVPLLPDIRVLPLVGGQPSLDFGTVQLDETGDRIFQIHNDGINVLKLTNIALSLSQFPLMTYIKTTSVLVDAIDPDVMQMLDEATIIAYLGAGAKFEPVKYSAVDKLLTIGYPDLNPGECLLIRAQFKPTSIGLKTGNLIIRSNDPNNSVIFMSLQGRASQEPNIRVSPTSINFGAVDTFKSMEKPLHIYNDGNAILNITSITSNDPQFTISQYANINPHSELLLTVKFTPASEGAKIAILRISTNDPDTPVILFNLQGNGVKVPGPDIDVSTTSIDFGEVELGKSLVKNFLLKNLGDVALQISDMVSSNSQFTVTKVSNVPPGTTMSMQARFLPTSVGAKAGLITITSNDPDEPTVTISVQGKGVLLPSPNIRISPTAIDFGDVEAGKSLAKNFNIYNDGSAILHIQSVTSNINQFVVQNTTDIPPNSSIVVPIQFAPTSLGLKEGTITVKSDDPDEPSKTLAVKGKGISPPAPDINIIPTSIDFGDVEVSKSLVKSFQIQNLGNSQLTISGITSSNAQFTVTSSGVTVFNSGESINISVRFTPVSSGLKTATVTITSNDPNESSVTVALQGRGFDVPDIDVYPVSIDFGDVKIGNSYSKDFNIYNRGNMPLLISDITSSNSQFTLTKVTSILPGTVSSIPVRFLPNSVGTKAGIITISSNDPDEPTVIISVQGNGTLLPTANIRISPTTIDFGDLAIGKSLTKNFNIYNDGTAILHIQSITSNTNQFVVQNASDIVPGSFIVVPVQFTPTSLGLKEGILTINSNDSNESSKTVAVRGNGITPTDQDINIIPTSIDFGDVQVGISLVKSFQIQNLGSRQLTIYGITSNSDQFVVIDDFEVFNAGDSMNVSVRFTPASTGFKTATVTVTSNDPDESLKTVTLQGRGFEVSVPDIEVYPVSIDFGAVEVGNSQSKDLNIYNRGSASLQISSITSNNSQFSVINPISIPAGSLKAVTVRFTPTSVGSKTATITIVSNDLDEPSVTVSLYGESIYPGYVDIGVWTPVQPSTFFSDLNDVFFTDDNNGWVVGYNGTIVNTNNGGISWSPQSSNTSRSLNSVFFTDPNTGWSVGQYGTILKTGSAGYLWSQLSSTVANTFRAIKFVTLNKGWAVGESGSVMVINDGFWTQQNSNTSFDLNDVSFANISQGWIVGNYGTILRTIDGGQNWTLQVSGTTSALYGVDFVSNYEGWAVGSNGTILHTQDGGQTWVLQNSNVNYATLTSVDFLSSTNGWIVGSNGIILHTINGGATWVQVDSGTTQTLRAVQFQTLDAGWAVGANGTILKYTPTSPTNITSVTVSGSPAHSGGVIKVTAMGQVRNTAKFSIAGVISNVSMSEAPLGTYIGNYTAVDGVNVKNAIVTVTFVNSYGNTTTDTSQKATIDTIAVIDSATVTPVTAKTGDTITITALGETGSAMRFTIDTIITDAVMTESITTPGKYIGEYKVTLGNNVTNANVSVKMTDPYGNSASKNAGLVSINTSTQIASVSITGSPAKLGEPLIIIMIGNPNGIAKFTIGDVAVNMAMTETQSGIYTGSFNAPKGTNVSNATVTVRLTDTLGNIATKDAGKVTIDTESKITSVTVTGSPGKAGGKIIVDLVAESNGHAKFSIAGIPGEITIIEQSANSGIYRGSYTIANNVNVTDAIVTVTFADAIGNIAVTDTSKKVTISTSIQIASVSVTGSPAKLGEPLIIIMVGDPNGIAKFTIGDVAVNMPMTETQSGVYTGSFNAPKGTNVSNVAVTLQLTDTLGNKATKDAGKVTIDTESKITSVTVSGSPGKAGGKIIVDLVGESNGRTKFSIAGIPGEITMTEQPANSGIYNGSYTVANNVNITDATVTVTLADAIGNASVTDTSKKVTIDNVLPKINTVNVSGSPTRLGGKITVNINGEPNSKARFNIAGMPDENMQEQPAGSGNYSGTYTVTISTTINDALVTVTLLDIVGNSVTDTSKKVTIDNTPPIINSVKVAGSPGKAGDKITVTMVGEPNGNAKFSITGVISDQGMTEQPLGSGTYTGAYTILNDVNATDASVTVTLSDQAGNTSTDSTQKVTIDTTVPRITAVSVSGSPAKVNETITITLVGEKGGIAQFSIAGVTQNVVMNETQINPGTYTGKYIVANDKGLSNAVVTVTLKDSAGNLATDTSKKITIVPSWDVNRDGTTSTSDLIAIANLFGQQVSGKNDADVNGDGVVNILDLVILSNHYGESLTPASPGKEGQISSENLSVLKNLYKSLEELQSNDPGVAVAKELLVKLIKSNTPQIAQSQLLQNYPNPFNPETWIPFKLSKPGTVNVSIYSSSGQMIRSIDLGYREMGDYSSRDKAIYWDGTNESGEKVSSGIYFYSIKMGDFTAIKKMIVKK